MLAFVTEEQFRPLVCNWYFTCVLIEVKLIYNVALVSAVQQSVSQTYTCPYVYMSGFPGGSVVQNLPAMQKTQETQV